MRKQRLEQIRDLYRPVTKQELLEHQKRIEEVQRKLEEAKRGERDPERLRPPLPPTHGEAYARAE